MIPIERSPPDAINGDSLEPEVGRQGEAGAIREGELEALCGGAKVRGARLGLPRRARSRGEVRDPCGGCRSRQEHREEGGGAQNDGVWINVRHSESLSARRSANSSSARLTPRATFENRWRRRSGTASRFSKTSRCPSTTATKVSPEASHFTSDCRPHFRGAESRPASPVENPGAFIARSSANLDTSAPLIGRSSENRALDFLERGVVLKY